MSHSEEQFSLNHLLQNPSISDPFIRLHLVRHYIELLGDLTRGLLLDLSSSGAETLPDTQEIQTPSSEDLESETTMLSKRSDYGDAGSLAKTRMEALDLFDSRVFEMYCYVAIWVDMIHVWGHPMLLCMGTTVEGYRQILGFLEAPPQDVVAMQRLFNDLTERGLPTGLFCITSGGAPLSRLIVDCLEPSGIQYCQFCKRESVLSFLGESESDQIKGAMKQAYEIPDHGKALDALMGIHADLLHRNRSAAHILEQDLDKTLTLHRTGHMSRLSRSLRTTRCIASIGQKLNKRLKELQGWLPPTDRRAQIALGLLEIELGMRTLDHASQLPALLKPVTS